MQEVGQAIDDRDVRNLSQLLDEVMAERARDDRIDPARQVRGDVRRRPFYSELKKLRTNANQQARQQSIANEDNQQRRSRLLISH